MSVATATVRPGGFVGSARKRSDVRGFLVHMAEGNNVAAYLSRNPSRNVSVQYVVEADGGIIAMVPELRVAGSLNPRTIRTTNDPDGYYGAKHAKAALKGLWSNPNKGVIAIEVAGKAVNGPNEAQSDALVRLYRDCAKRYPGIVPLGHRDFQSVKRCPGKTAAMKKAFSRMGGHGRDYDPTPTPTPKPEPPPPAPADELLGRISDLEADSAAKQAGIRRAIDILEDLLDEETDDVPEEPPA